jgi:beta-galactosidase
MCVVLCLLAGIEKGFTALSSLTFNAAPYTPTLVVHQVGLMGEAGQWALLPSDSDQWLDTSSCQSLYAGDSLVWYRAQLDVDLSSDPDGVFAVDMGSMMKGALWVNGLELGRYWLIIAPGSTAECQPCNYAGTYDPSRCRTGCGEPSQRFYHVPRSYLKDGGNDVTFLEEYSLSKAAAPALVTIVRMN